MDTEYISLGSTCSVAYQLQTHCIKKCTYPFDWVRINKFSNINELLKSNFEDFDKIQVKIIENLNKFPLIDDDFVFNDKKTIICENKFATFYHDFDSIENIPNQYKKYERRIDRLYNILRSNNHIHFIRDELKPNSLHIDDIIEFDNILKYINPNIKYTFTIVIHNSKNKEYPILKLKLNNINIINDTNTFADWIRPNIDWSEIFK
jgi:hypothetical protein